MAKQQQRSKDPKKVAAGKARAARAVRIDGKFVTKYFQEELQKDADAVGYNGPLQDFLDQNEIQYSDLYNTGSLRAPDAKAITTIFNDATKYEGSLLMNGEAANVHDVKYRVLQVEQWLQSNTNAAGVAYKPTLYFKGMMELNLPTIEELDELFESMSEDEAAQYLSDEYGITVWLSSKKGKSKNEKARISHNKDKRAAYLKKLSKGVKKNKGRTRR